MGFQKWKQKGSYLAEMLTTKNTKVTKVLGGHGTPCPYSLRLLRPFDFAQGMPLRLYLLSFVLFVAFVVKTLPVCS
jgi:hypothetical protein